MPRTETVLQVFVASPSDVAEERSTLEEIIRELNITWSKTLGLRLELLKWETHAYPDFGNTPQEVINKQIGEKYDIFIGVMWSKFGTPTGKFGSGTEEEFETAYQIYNAKHQKLWLMLYFKDAGLPLSQLDLHQLELINNFRQRIGNEGGLYWKFQSKEEFTKLLRLHLSRVVQEWREANDAPKNLAIISKNKDLEVLDSIDEGFLDVIEATIDKGSKVEEISARIGNIMTDVGVKTEARTVELSKVIADTSSPHHVRVRAARRITDHSADDLDEFSARLQIEIPFFKTSFSEAVDSMTKVVMFNMDNKGKNPESVEEAVSKLNELLTPLKLIFQQINGFRQSIIKLPNVSARYNKSRVRAAKQLDSLMDQFASAIRLTEEMQSVIKKSQLNESHP